jgi:hypothetical protein
MAHRTVVGEYGAREPTVLAEVRTTRIPSGERAWRTDKLKTLLAHPVGQANGHLCAARAGPGALAVVMEGGTIEVIAGDFPRIILAGDVVKTEDPEEDDNRDGTRHDRASTYR